MIYWLQGNQRRSWANDCEGEGEGQAEERPRHRQDVRVHHGRRRHGGEVGKGGQENDLFSYVFISGRLFIFLYVFISGRLNRERNSDESERQWKLARRKRRCGICQENILLLFYGEHFSDMCFMRHRMSCEWQQFSWNLTLKRITRLGEGNWKRGNCRCLRGMRRLSPSSRTSGVIGPRRFLGDFDF